MYAANYAAALRYGADAATVEAIAKQMTVPELTGNAHKYSQPDTDWNRRLVLADSLRDQDRNGEADLVGDLSKPVAYHEGQFKPGVVRFRDAHFNQTDDASEMLNHIDSEGPEAALAHAKDNHDNDEGPLHQRPGTDSSRSHSDGTHTIYWHPQQGYWGLVQQHVLPESAAKAVHYSNGHWY